MPLPQVEGINLITAERLSEEGIEYIQHLALCSPLNVAVRTGFPLDVVKDWKDQAILYLLAGDVAFNHRDNQKDKRELSLYDILDIKLGIRKFSSLLSIWEEIEYDGDTGSFFAGLGLSEDDKDIKRLVYLFQNIITDGRRLLTEHFVIEPNRL